MNNKQILDLDLLNIKLKCHYSNLINTINMKQKKYNRRLIPIDIIIKLHNKLYKYIDFNNSNYIDSLILNNDCKQILNSFIMKRKKENGIKLFRTDSTSLSLNKSKNIVDELTPLRYYELSTILYEFDNILKQ